MLQRNLMPGISTNLYKRRFFDADFRGKINYFPISVFAQHRFTQKTKQL